ncbi:hypothetical protein QBC39DRAFT_381051 [Podospora conica]|nr:hypothetical protein QBC39DRAFT_381051 [Schizothecium conicum]
MKLLLAITALTLLFLSPTLASPTWTNSSQPRTGHAIQVVRRHTTLLKVLRQAPYANTSSTSVPLPTWNASAAFTFFPSNSSASNSVAAPTQAQNSTAPKSSGSGGLLGGLLSGVLDPITSGVLGPITSGIATGLGTGVGSLAMPTGSLLSSVRWPNSTSAGAVATGVGNGTKLGA